MAASDHLQPAQHPDVMAGKRRAAEAQANMTPEQRTKAVVMKAEALDRFTNRMYLDMEHEDPKGNVRAISVPKDVKDHGAYLADWASKNPPRKADYFNRTTAKRKTHHA